MYESRKDAPVSHRQFMQRLVNHALVVFAVLAGSLALGMAGYMTLERLSAVDAFLNAAMLLGGMGPVNSPQTTGGKLFAGFYALYAGLVFIVTTGLMLTPVAHRLLHRFHMDDAAR
jgi:hypothetical protein